MIKKFCIYGSRRNVAKFDHLTITAIDKQIHRCYQYQYLGIILDECLTMKQNVNNVFKKFSHKIYQFGKIRNSLSVETRILVYKQTVLPLIEYVSFILTLLSIGKLQKLQNRALRLCYNIPNRRDITVLRLHELANVDLLHKRRMLQLMSMMYDLKIQTMYEKNATRVTRQADKYIF